MREVREFKPLSRFNNVTQIRRTSHISRKSLENQRSNAKLNYDEHQRSNTGTGIQIQIPSHIRPSSLLLRFPDHASRTVRIVLRDGTKEGNVLFDSATSKNVEARNNAVHSARTFLLSNQSEKDSF